MKLPEAINTRTKKLIERGIAGLGPAIERRDVNGANVIRFHDADRVAATKAGQLLAEACLGGSGAVSIVPSSFQVTENNLAIKVEIESPLVPCIGCQYAGWPISHEDFFAMASGPIRLIRGKEKVLQEYNLQQSDTQAVAVLETAKQPDSSVVEAIASEIGIPTSGLTICLASTSSLPGRMQIVARSVETAMHKLHELDFDLRSVHSGIGMAPIPPDGTDDLAALGWTNDAMLYGADVKLQIDGDDTALEQLVGSIPSCSSDEFGKPFIELFKHYDYDFYKIDPLLFSPAKVTLENINTGRVFEAGEVRADILQSSFEHSE